MTTRLARGAELLLDWLLPTVCAACERPLAPGAGAGVAPDALRGGGPGVGPGTDAPPRGWCAGCAAALPGRTAARCPACGERSPEATAAPAGQGPADAPGHVPGRAPACPRCRASPPPFDRTIVLADYAPPLDHLIQAIKFGRESALAAPLGRLLAQQALRSRADDPGLRLAAVTAVTAVPLAPARLAGRGFNQALLLAGPVARAFGLAPAPGLLRRVRPGAPASSLGAAQRRGALEHAFAARGVPAGATVIVVDDVMTTGATLRAAAVALKAAGAAVVVNCVAARTAAPGDR